MLDHTNLEEFQDPANYDIEQRNAAQPSITFYTELAVALGGPVLDLACGTGLVAIPIARRGLDVAGVDLAAPMLAYARHKSADLPIQWIEADARSFHLARQFRLIFMTGNAFQAFLTRADQEALLQRVHEHLQPVGTFAFETRNPRCADLVTQSEEEHWDRYSDVDGNLVDMSGTFSYEHESQVMHWTTYRRWRTGDQTASKVSRIATRYSYPQELATILHYNGFCIAQQYGSWDREPLSALSPTIINICQKL